MSLETNNVTAKEVIQGTKTLESQSLSIEQAKESMKKEREKFQHEMEVALTKMSIEYQQLLDSDMPLVEKKKEVPNIMGKLRTFFTGNAFRKLMTAVATYGMYFGPGMSQAKTAEDFENKNNIEIAHTEDKESNTNEATDLVFNSEGGTNPESDNKETKKNSENAEATLESYKIDIDSSFELGKAVNNQQEQEHIRNNIVRQISSWPDELQQGLKTGKYKLKISAGCSPELIRSAIDVGNGEIVDNNHDLSIKRMEFGENRIQEASRELGFKLKVDRAEAFKDGINPQRPERYVQIALEIDQERSIDKGLSGASILEHIPKGVIEEIYVDASTSMKGKVVEFYKNLKDHGYINEGQSIKLRFGSERGQITESFSVKTQEDVEIRDINIRSKEKFGDKEDSFANALLLIKKYPGLSPEERASESLKIIPIMTDEYLMISAESIASIQTQETYRNIELVFVLQNRETGESQSFTTQELQKLYEHHAKGTEVLTLDINSKKIEGGNVDIVVDLK